MNSDWLVDAARAAMLGALVAAVGCAPPPPVTLVATYTERTAVSKPGPKAATAACNLLVDGVSDSRSDTTVLGVVLSRAVKAPSDNIGWIQNVLSGLSARGVALGFDTNVRDAPADSIHARFDLKTAWLTDTATNKTANVVIRVLISRGGETALDRNFRGSRTTINWSASDSELQKVIDEAFGKALDDIAGAVLPICAVTTQ